MQAYIDYPETLLPARLQIGLSSRQGKKERQGQNGLHCSKLKSSPPKKIEMDPEISMPATRLWLTTSTSIV